MKLTLNVLRVTVLCSKATLASILILFKLWKPFLTSWEFMNPKMLFPSRIVAMSDNLSQETKTL